MAVGFIHAREQIKIYFLGGLITPTGLRFAKKISPGYFHTTGSSSSKTRRSETAHDLSTPLQIQGRREYYLKYT
jgi:hypothetical protein